MINNDEDKFIKQVCSSLDFRLSSMDETVISDLKRARLHALSSKTREPADWRWLPVASLASVAAMCMLVVLLHVVTPQHDHSTTNSSDIDLLLSQEDFELLDQLEFYRWLENENTES